jgi:hypothetical protein
MRACGREGRLIPGSGVDQTQGGRGQTSADAPQLSS